MSDAALAGAFFTFAFVSLVVHATVLILIVRIGVGTQTMKGYRRLRRTLRIRVLGGVLYTATGAVAVFATPTTAFVALLVFAAMTILYAVSSIADWLSWQAQQKLALR